MICAGEEDGEEGKQTGVQTGETDAGEADGWLKSKCSGYEALIGFLRERKQNWDVLRASRHYRTLLLT